MAILVVLDLADGPGSLFAQLGPDVLVSALFAILLMGEHGPRRCPPPEEYNS